MRIYRSHTRGYSTLLALLLIGFMITLTVWVHQLVLREFQDTKAMEYSLKAFSWAEWSLELALLRAKEYGYALEAQMDTTNILSKTLFADTSKRIYNKDVSMEYTIQGAVSGIENAVLWAYEFHIIPLFYYDNTGMLQKMTGVYVSDVSDDILWNIVGTENGVSGSGKIDASVKGKQKKWVINPTTGELDTSLSSTLVHTYLSTTEGNYLMLQNPTAYDMTYTLSTKYGEKIGSDWMTIQGSGEVWGFQQTLQVRVHTSEYLNVLKYVIFWE